MNKIAIFGGTFDPVHSEHVSLVSFAIEKLQLDKVIVMPTFSPPHKEDAVATFGQRFDMLKLAFDGLKKVEISDYEISNGGKSYTYITVEYFKNLYPNSRLFFLVGGDMLNDFFTWKNPRRILDCCDLVACGREDVFNNYESLERKFIATFNKSFIRLDFNGKECSSTKIRVYSSLNLDINGLTDPKVVNYIKENHVYKGDFYTDFLINNLTAKRLLHTANVAVTAMSKTKELNLSRKKVLTACLLHDCAKYLNKDCFTDFNLDADVPKPVVHAFLGAYVCENVLGITDPEIVDAIRYHTSGKPNMSQLAKLVFVADMIEPLRDYDGVDVLREYYYKKGLDECFVKALDEETIHLKNKGEPIYKETINAYNYYCKK